MKTLFDRALTAAVTIVVVILLLHWGWSLLRPLVPILGAGVVLTVMVAAAYHHWRNRHW